MEKKTLQRIVLIIAVVLIILLIIIALAAVSIRKNIATGGTAINEYLTRHCSDPAVLNSRDYAWTANFRQNWQSIRQEFDAYSQNYVVPAYKDVNKGSSGDTDGWKALFLRVFNNDTQMMEFFPKTKALLATCPCTTAYFSLLEPGTHIPEHRGVYKGVLRYHLSLVVPDDWQNCFIVVDGKKLHWREGDDLMFDDMYLHHVENNTNQKRVVLFLDIKRDFKSLLVNFVNTIMLKFIKCNDVLLTTVEKANRLSRQDSESYSRIVQAANGSSLSALEKLRETLAASNLVSVTDLQ